MQLRRIDDHLGVDRILAERKHVVCARDTGSNLARRRHAVEMRKHLDIGMLRKYFQWLRRHRLNDIYLWLHPDISPLLRLSISNGKSARRAPA